MPDARAGGVGPRPAAHPHKPGRAGADQKTATRDGGGAPHFVFDRICASMAGSSGNGA